MVDREELKEAPPRRLVGRRDQRRQRRRDAGEGRGASWFIARSSPIAPDRGEASANCRRNSSHTSSAS
jgi:hypothetical protein